MNNIAVLSNREIDDARPGLPAFSNFLSSWPHSANRVLIVAVVSCCREDSHFELDEKCPAPRRAFCHLDRCAERAGSLLYNFTRPNY
jgi:hypothetical protein